MMLTTFSKIYNKYLYITKYYHEIPPWKGQWDTLSMVTRSQVIFKDVSLICDLHIHGRAWNGSLMNMGIHGLYI